MTQPQKSNPIADCSLALSAGLGFLLALAVLLRHIPRMLQPESYWNGLLTENLILSVPFTGIGLMISVMLAYREKRGQLQ